MKYLPLTLTLPCCYVMHTAMLTYDVGLWCLPSDHEMYCTYNKHVKDIVIPNIIRVLKKLFEACPRPLFDTGKLIVLLMPGLSDIMTAASGKR